MITTLTKSQKLSINQIRDEWLKLCQTQHNITINDVEKGVEQLYALDNRKKPLILILNDPLQCQYLSNILSNKKGNQIRSQISSQIDNQISSQKLQYFDQLGGLSWRSWYYSYFEYYIKTGLLKLDSSLKQKLCQQIEFLKKGVWELIVFENLCIISKCPKTKRDDNQRLHSLNSKAVEFPSGYGFYSIHGVLFDKKLWEKVKDRKLNPNELLKLENVDQRFVAINHYGIENMMKELNTKLLNTGKYGNKLYSFMFENEDLRLLSYPDIDNKKERVAFINPKFIKADEAMANKHNCTLEQYYAMEILK